MIRIIKKPDVKKCCKCGDPVFSVHSMYCASCARLAFRMKARRFPPEAEEGVWEYIRTDDKRCYYSKMPLVMDDIKSQWYCVFDHLIPLDPRQIVLTSALINEMKIALSEREFWFYIEQLCDFIVKGKKIKKIKLAYWRRHQSQTQVISLPYFKKPKWPDPKAKKCCICGVPVFKLRSKYCLRCSIFNHRMEIKRFSPQVKEAIRKHLRLRGYVCQITGLPLVMDNSSSPWYGVFNCRVPGDRSTVILTFALLDEMKSDLSIKEFWYYIRQLANYKRKHTPIKKKKLVYWRRLTPKELYAKSLRD